MCVAENERDFKGVWIPKTIWLDERLNSLDKVILTEIDSLDKGERGCYASNQHIANFCQCSEWKVSTSVSKLIKLGYVYVQKFDGRQRELKSRLSNFQSQPCEKPKAEMRNSQESNTDNKPVTNTENIKYIVDYLNEKTGSSFRSTSKATQKLIHARMNEGFEVEDFIKVIDNQTAKWLNSEWAQYLRPSTLFGTKFENYLNANRRTQTDGQATGDSVKGRVGNYI